MLGFALSLSSLCFFPHSHIPLVATQPYDEVLRAGASAGFWGLLRTSSSTWLSPSLLLIRTGQQGGEGAELWLYLSAAQY